jgi:hypothetical protein
MRGLLDRLTRNRASTCISARRIAQGWYSRGLDPATAAHYAQVETTTGEDRYPKVMALCAQISPSLQPQRSPQRILSFGCSSGEECHSLASHFPEAQIVGTDINRAMLARAQEANANPRITFLGPTQLDGSGLDFEFVFALSVLCRFPESRYLDDLSQIFPHSRFEQIVERIDSFILPGGIFVLINTNYDFLETVVGQRYRPIDSPKNKRRTHVPLFGRDSRKITQGQPDFLPLIYQKEGPKN